MRNQPDFEAALAIFRRMTHLAPGAEEGEVKGLYEAKTPNGKPVDSLGTKWARDAPIQADAKAMSLLLKTALSRDWRDVHRAMMVFFHVDGVQLLDGPSVDRAGGRKEEGKVPRQWEQDLRQDVDRACEKLLEKSLPQGEKDKIEALWNQVKSPREEPKVPSMSPRSARPHRAGRSGFGF
jgi:hypothetical protein